jgi:hypothetical protein
MPKGNRTPRTPEQLENLLKGGASRKLNRDPADVPIQVQYRITAAARNGLNTLAASKGMSAAKMLEGLGRGVFVLK